MVKPKIYKVILSLHKTVPDFEDMGLKTFV